METPNKLFIGNIAYSTSLDSIRKLVEENGGVITDSYLGKGFGFITLETSDQANDLIEKLNGYNLDGRALSVSIARPKTDKPKRDFGNNSRGGFGYNRERRDNRSNNRY